MPALDPQAADRRGPQWRSGYPEGRNRSAGRGTADEMLEMQCIKSELVAQMVRGADGRERTARTLGYPCITFRDSPRVALPREN